MTSTTTQQTEAAQREIRYEHTRDLAEVLSALEVSLLISTYQAGKLVAVGTCQEKLSLSFHSFDHPMGIALDPRLNKMAVATKDKVWLLRDVPHVAKQLEPVGSYDACLLTREARVTGEIQAHEMAWAEIDLWVVNTLFSCLCTLDPNYSFVPQWRPPFISRLVAEDRCHLNGLAVADGRPRFVTALAETDTASAWRERKAETGCLIDVASGETVARGFAMPHSPRVHDGKVWLLDSGRGRLVTIDLANGQGETVARFPGYTRGLSIHGDTAFIGLSRIRETSTFGGIPIAEDRERLKCGVAIVNLTSGELLGQFEFKDGVEEIFDVSVLPNRRQVALRGPFAADDGLPTLWTVPHSASGASSPTAS